jgi:hypothetical protein
LNKDPIGNLILVIFQQCCKAKLSLLLLSFILYTYHQEVILGLPVVEEGHVEQGEQVRREEQGEAVTASQ